MLALLVSALVLLPALGAPVWLCLSLIVTMAACPVGHGAEPGRLRLAGGLTFGQRSAFDGQRLATSTGDAAYLWDVVSGNELRRLPGHATARPEGQGHVIGVVFSPDGARLATTSFCTAGLISMAWCVRVWDVATWEEIRAYSEISHVAGVQFSPDGRQILIVDGKQLALLDIQSGRRFSMGPATCLQNFLEERSLCFSPDGKRILQMADGNRTAVVMNSTAGKRLFSIACADGEFLSVRFSPDGRLLLTTSSGGAVRTWDAEAGRPLQMFVGHTGSVGDGLFVANGRTIITVSDALPRGSVDISPRLWDTATGREIRRFQLPAGSFFPQIIVSADGKRLITRWRVPTEPAGAHEENAALWDVESGREIGRPSEEAQQIVGFSPTDERFMVVKGEKPAALWDGATGKIIRQYP